MCRHCVTHSCPCCAQFTPAASLQPENPTSGPSCVASAWLILKPGTAFMSRMNRCQPAMSTYTSRPARCTVHELRTAPHTGPELDFQGAHCVAAYQFCRLTPRRGSLTCCLLMPQALQCPASPPQLQQAGVCGCLGMGTAFRILQQKLTVFANAACRDEPPLLC